MNTYFETEKQAVIAIDIRGALIRHHRENGRNCLKSEDDIEGALLVLRNYGPFYIGKTMDLMSVTGEVHRQVLENPEGGETRYCRLTEKAFDEYVEGGT